MKAGDVSDRAQAAARAATEEIPGAGSGGEGGAHRSDDDAAGEHGDATPQS